MAQTDELTKVHAQQELERLQEQLDIQFSSFYCSNCGRFLLSYAILEGTVVMKCRRCKEQNVLDIHSLEIMPDGA